MPMAARTVHLLLKQEYYSDLALRAPNETARIRYLNLARLYEVEDGLLEKAHRCISESRQLILTTELLLNRGHLSRAVDPAFRDIEFVTDATRPQMALDVDPEPALSQLSEFAVGLKTLTPREREIMDKVIAGDANKVIAAELGVSQRTVEHHRQSVMRKMGAKSLAALVRMAVAGDSPLPSR